ncbi:uroporphyrinogen-III C-methyltransferase [Stackebrandtia nassauensis]|uniref:Uroporphyrin-III C-methyltransferase n=1 Tax=Stackebrandtia nassauensis (strain DSM 44728 / CIP 108903 / NRRL B-16338 / NBRC 102104 / LLR-40K-21) TaxID=446470 RepID=D3Q6R3_STANL|nr:uroporphyrin-III C-methyltransferase [Stackebrandtia nassauensis DSM 44728]
MYPLGLRLDRRRVLVVGAGNLAHRRVPRLLDAGADVLLVSPHARDSLRAMASEHRLRWEERRFQASDLDGAWLVLAATDDPAVNAEISALAEEARVFCVRADDREAATAWTPAVGQHEELTFAAFAGGDPRRAAALRDRLLELAATGEVSPPRFRGSGTIPGVALVGAGPGDPDLITVAGRAALAQADVVIADRLAPARLLEELRDETELIDAAKIPYGRQREQDEIIALMLERAKNGKFVVRLKGGDGFVFGRGGEELDACAAAGIPVRVIPGVTSAIAGPALASIPVTERGLVHEFTIVSGHVAPGDPTSLTNWDALARLRGTVVVLMGVRHRGAIAAALIAGGRDAGTPAAVVMDASTPRQREVRTTLAELGDVEVTSPAVLVIGEVTRQR